MKKIIFLLLITSWSASLFSKNSTDEYTLQMQKLLTTYRMINGLYVDDVDAKEIVESATIAMLKELDPHSAYISAEDVKKMNEPLQGNFDGIGIQFNVLEDSLIVISPIPGGPSEKVGVMAGDRIVKVDTTTIAGVKCSRNKMMSLLRGQKGTKVTIFVKRKGSSEPLSFRITRDKIPIYSMDAAYMIDDKTGYIKLNRFAATTHKEFKEALLELQKEGLVNLIIDLQDNGGGYMSPSIEIADELLEKDKQIVYTEGNNSPKQSFSSRSGGAFEKGKLVIIVNEGSASASEILSGAIQDWDRGYIVGRRTFGKGLVQKPLNLPDGAMIRLTTARYYTPSGRCIQKPYVKGEGEEYGKDLVERYEHGELLSADSIDHPDSLKYQTLIEGRTVYGGGGIIPDFFVPIDTISYSDFHREVVYKGVLNQYMLTYIDNNRTSLIETYKNFDDFNENYKVTDEVFSGLVNKAASDSIVYDEEEFAVSRDFLFLQMKALVARDLYEMSEYYQVMNSHNDTYLKAIELINEKRNNIF